MKSFFAALTVFGVLSSVLCIAVMAVAEIPVLEQRVTEDSVTLYIRRDAHTGGTSKAVRVTFDDGRFAQTQVEMPLSEETISLSGIEPIPSKSSEVANESAEDGASGHATDSGITTKSKRPNEANQSAESATENANNQTISNIAGNENGKKAAVENGVSAHSSKDSLKSPHEEASADPLLVKKIIAAGLIVMIVIAALVIIIRHRKKSGEPKSEKEEQDKQQPLTIPNIPEGDLLQNNKTVYMGGGPRIEAENNKTVYMGNYGFNQPKKESPRMTVSFKDLHAPDTLFEIVVSAKQDLEKNAPTYEVTVGRASDNDIVIEYNKTISGHHCKIVWVGTDVQVYDLGSKNGTMVNGTPLSAGESISIGSGSLLQIGEVPLRLEYRTNEIEASESATGGPTLW